MQRGDRLITDKKITAADYTDKDVASAPDRLTGTAQENKAIFDRAVKEVVQPKYNALIDELDTELSSRIVSDDILKMRLDEDGVVEYSADGTDYVKMIGRHGVKGDGTPATGAEIFNHPDNVASAPYSHAEGGGCDAIGSFSHAEGNSTTASGVNSHAEGNSTRANGECSHAEGRSAQSYGKAAHAEGWFTTASGDYSHAEGVFSTASGESAHAQGHETVASGNCSYAGGYGTIASADNQFVMGKYNMGDANAAVIIGNGTDYKAPSNAMTLDWDGNLKLKGDVTFAATRSLASELDELHAYEVPVAGDELGGVKNGGNVIVNPDGTMTAPDVGAMLNRADFTQTDARWSALTDGRYTLTLSLEDQNPICVFRKDGDRYKLAVCDIESMGGSINVVSYDKFDGYLLTAQGGEVGGSSNMVRSVNGAFPNEAGAVTLTASQVGAAPVGHVSDGTRHITAAERTRWNAKVGKSIQRTVTLSKTDWTGNEPPYTYDLSVSGVTATSAQEILPTTSATEEQIIALQAANMQDGGQSVGKVTIKAWGDKPEIDLPVRIIIRGDL